MIRSYPIRSLPRPVNSRMDLAHPQNLTIALRVALKAELRNFNAKYRNDAGNPCATADAETVKFPVEKLLGVTFPDWLKGIFEILNDLLKLLT